MADASVDTSIYPKASQNSFLDTMTTVQGLKNAAIQNQLLQTETQRQNVGLSQDKITLAHQGFQWLSQGLGSLAQDPRIATPAGPEMLKQFAAQGIKQGWLTPEVAQAEIDNMPQDPAQMPQYVQNLNVRAQDAAGQFAQIYGSPGTISNGNTIVPVTSSPIMGVRRIGADIPMQTSPGERATGVPGFDDQNRPTITPMGTVLQRAGYNPLNAMPATAPAPSATNQMQPYPQGQAPVPANNGSVPMGPPAGQVEAQATTAKAGADKFSQDSAREASFQSDIIPLQKARDALVSLGPTGTGPGTEQINEVKSFLTSMGVLNPSDEVKNFDEARKYLVQYASQAGSPNTNDKLAAAFAGNPNVGISNAASVDVLKTAMSVRRMQNAQVRAFGASGENPASYNQWATKFNASQDPVAYGFDMMSPADRTKYVKGLSSQGKQKFITSLQTATQLGLVAPPQAAQGN